jgi:hypothetical protein
LVNTDTGVSAQTDYTISFNTVNQLPMYATFQIGYPATVGVPSSSGYTYCQVFVSNVAYQMTCTTDSTNKIIKMTGGGSGLTVPVSSSTPVKLKFGLITNPDTQLSASIFTMTSYTDDS